MFTRLLVLVVVAVLAAGGVAMAQSSRHDAASVAAEVVFSELEKRVLKDYFGVERRDRDTRHYDRDRERHQGGGKKGGLPPGLAKKDRLPPGLQRQLERNGTLPPGLAKRDLPSDLESRLPRRASRFERKIVGNDIVLLEAGTNLVLDVLHDVLTGAK